MTQHPPGNIRGWTVVLAAVGVNLIIGALYAWSVMGKALAGQWHWTKTQAMLPFATATASFAVTMIFAGRWQDRIGPRYVAMLGGILFGLGMVLSAFVHTYGLMLITFGLVGGMGIGLGYSATTPPSIKWFPPAKKGLITGIVVSGVGLAAVYISPLTNYLLKVTSIQQTFFILGAGTIVLVSLLAQLLANPPAGYAPAPAEPSTVSGAKPAPAVRHDLDWHEMLRTRQFYQLWLMFVLSASAGLLIIGNITLIAQDRAPEWDKAFLLVMVVAIFNTCGRFVSGFLSDRIGRTNTMILASVLQAINMFLFTQYRTPALLVFGSAFTGLCYGTIFTLFPAATADFYGVRNLGVNYGSVFTAFGVAGVTGSVLGGRVRDLFGSYTYAFIACGVMLLAGAVLAFLLKAPKTDSIPPAPPADGGNAAKPGRTGAIKQAGDPCMMNGDSLSLCQQRWPISLCALGALWLCVFQVTAAEQLSIEKVEPTPLYPKAEKNQPLRQADPAKIKTFAKDSNNQWADQDATDAWLLALARRQGEAIPTAEKFSTIATTLAGGGYPWADIYQAYHRLLQYHEHTDAIDFINCDPERMRQYETELAENREMVIEAKEFSDRACDSALDKLAGMIATRADRNVMVFNPLARTRSDVVRLAAEVGQRFQLRDAATGKDVPHQALADGTTVFVAAEVPALGYKTFSLRTLDPLPNSEDAWNSPEALSKSGVSFPLTPALSLRERVPCGPSLGMSERRDLSWRGGWLSLSPRERAGVRGNGAQVDSTGSNLLSSSNTLENRFYHVAFDPVTGAITSIRDKQLDVELVDRDAPHKFNEYLYERYESAQARTSKWYRVQSAQMSAISGPVASIMTIKASAVGADQIRQTVTVDFPEVVTTDALRVFVPAADLPKAERADVDGIVRICELLLVLPDGKESPAVPLLQP